MSRASHAWVKHVPRSTDPNDATYMIYRLTHLLSFALPRWYWLTSVSVWWCVSSTLSIVDRISSIHSCWSLSLVHRLFYSTDNWRRFERIRFCFVSLGSLDPYPNQTCEDQSVKTGIQSDGCILLAVGSFQSRVLRRDVRDWWAARLNQWATRPTNLESVENLRERWACISAEERERERDFAASERREQIFVSYIFQRFMNGGIQLFPTCIQFFDLRSQFTMRIGCWMSAKDLWVRIGDLLQFFAVVLQCTFEVLFEVDTRWMQQV